MKTTEITVLEEVELDNPIFIEALPGLGHVGKLAADHMIDELGATKFAEIYSPTFPPQVLVKDEGVIENMFNELYYLRDVGEDNLDLIILVGNTQSLSPEGQYLTCKEILEFVKQFDIDRIYTLGGMVTSPQPVENPKVFGAATNEANIELLKEADIEIRANDGGIVGASGTGIQHVAAILHEAGSGVSQTIGTGGNDLKEPVGGITMLMGIDALEADPETKYIILISRKPADSVLEKMLARIRTMKKPRVVFFMGCDKETIEETGAVWADNLDNCALRALELVGNDYSLGSLDELKETAKEAVKGMAPEQKYVRAAYTGGTYLDEGMRTMWDAAGGIWSNAPLSPEWKLADGEASKGHTAIDYGEEEFTLGRPHPAIDASIRRPAILKEAADPETAVIVLDFILTPPGHMDPCGFVVPDIKKAQEIAKARGGKIAFVASVLGTTADWQDIRKQEEELREAGVYVCRTNYRAALLASEIIRLRKEIA